MPIVSTQSSTKTQADGSLLVTIRLFDQDGREYPYQFPANADFNVEAKITAMVAEMNEQLAQAEFQALVGL